MYTSAKAIKGLSVMASDGQIGGVQDLLFDDESWTIRYLVVNVGDFLARKTVLISPHHVLSIDKSGDGVRVSLTKQKIEECPNIDTDAPVSRRAESLYNDYLNIPAYWQGPFLWGGSAYSGIANPMNPDSLVIDRVSGRTPNSIESNLNPPPREVDKHADETTHIRSFKEVHGYTVAAMDSEFGSIDDLVIDEKNWAIRYFVIDTVRFWFGKAVIVPPLWANKVSWENRSIEFDLKKDQIKTAPEFDSVSQITLEFEKVIHAHYGRKGYWANENSSY